MSKNNCKIYINNYGYVKNEIYDIQKNNMYISEKNIKYIIEKINEKGHCTIIDIE